jgi:hypothetical protein
MRPAGGGDRRLVIPVQRAQAIGLEIGQARPGRLDCGADRFQRAQRLLPRLGHAHRLGCHQHKLGAACERLAQAHPAHHPERFGGSRDLAHALL